MKPKVIVYNSMPKELIRELAEHADVVEARPEDSVFKKTLPLAAAIIGSALKVDKQFLEQARKLKMVVNISAGYDNLDIAELTAHGIMVTNTPDVLVETTADMIFGLMLSSARRIPELDRYVKSGEWKGKIPESLFGMDISHKTLGIIGMGSIGKAIAERGRHGFKMKILYHNRSRDRAAEVELDAHYESLENLLKQSDFVCLMAPLTQETIGMIGKQEFKWMKKSAIFVNGARGQLVKEEEMIEALKDGEILAAGLDVYSQEPVNLDNPLLKMKNVVTTPHLGSGTYETRYAMKKLAVENLLKGLNGEMPPNLINPKVLDN